jgi:intracellular septation protein
MTLGVAQICWQFARKRPIDTMRWMTLFLVLGSGAATLITNDPRFVMVKPSLIYAIVGVMMLKPGWVNRYLPPVAIEVVPDIAFILGFVWSGLMFSSAALNVIVVLNFSVATWASFMSIYAIVSKAALFMIAYATMRYIDVRRRRAQMIPALPSWWPDGVAAGEVARLHLLNLVKTTLRRTTPLKRNIIAWRRCVQKPGPKIPSRIMLT